jgi:hypothetical protein
MNISPLTWAYTSWNTQRVGKACQNLDGNIIQHYHELDEIESKSKEYFSYTDAQKKKQSLKIGIPFFRDMSKTP